MIVRTLWGKTLWMKENKVSKWRFQTKFCEKYSLFLPNCWTFLINNPFTTKIIFVLSLIDPLHPLWTIKHRKILFGQRTCHKSCKKAVTAATNLKCSEKWQRIFPESSKTAVTAATNLKCSKKWQRTFPKSSQTAVTAATNLKSDKGPF